MTTTVIIKAHCAANKEVTASITNCQQDGTIVAVETVTLQDGEVAERVVYDNREITVREIIKG